MNRVFKTAWSSIRQQYVVMDEHHAAKGKATKSAVAIAVAALLTVSGAASAVTAAVTLMGAAVLLARGWRIRN